MHLQLATASPFIAWQTVKVSLQRLLLLYKYLITLPKAVSIFLVHVAFASHYMFQVMLQ